MSDSSKALQNALYYLTEQQQFMGHLLQEFNMMFSPAVPSASVGFNRFKCQWEIYINPEFFLMLKQKERVDILHHEILHFTNQHPFRLPMQGASAEDKKLYNISADMAINQYLHNLPKGIGIVDVAEWKYKDLNGKEVPFPKFQTAEVYLDLIKNNRESNKDIMDKYIPFDEHDWESLDAETKEKMLQEAKKMLKRTIEKSAFGYSNTPDSVKDLLKDLDAMSESLNYKKILMDVIKRTVSTSERQHTWKRPNKRYGVHSPGNKVGELPKLKYYGDTSGSISHTELNEFLDIMDGFLSVGTRQCMLALWHTSVYAQKKYKKGARLTETEIEAGGTDVTQVFEDINRTKPDLAIIFTDMYFEMPNIKTTGEVLFIVSKGGNKNLPLQNKQKVIYLDKLT